MKRYATLLAVAWMSLLAAPCALLAQGEGQGDLAKRMLGTWRMVATKYGEAQEFAEIPRERQTTYKHFAPDGTVWAEWAPETGKVINCAGGTWATQGDQFHERPIYGIGPKFDSIRDKDLAFTITFEGDRWTQSGAIGEFKLAETWERVPGVESDDNDLAGKLVGMWRLAAFQYDIPKEILATPDVPQEGQTTIKWVTPTHFTWITTDPQTRKVTRVAGGTWCVRGGNFIEKALYGLVGGFENRRDQEIAYALKLDGDRWEHALDTGKGVKLAETWERVKPAPAE